MVAFPQKREQKGGKATIRDKTRDRILERFSGELKDLIKTPVFDALWNASGYMRCLHYTPNGKWNPSK